MNQTEERSANRDQKDVDDVNNSPVDVYLVLSRAAKDSSDNRTPTFKPDTPLSTLQSTFNEPLNHSPTN